MTLYLVRHAIAEPRGPEWPDDAVRPLTTRGIARMREVVDGLAARGVQVEGVWSSPLTRARQTADILAAAWSPARRIDIVSELAPGRTPSAQAAALPARGGIGAAAVVGHEPELGVLLAWWLGARLPVPFKKGGVACIEIPPALARGTAELQWLVTPRLMRES
jgi:phosphohistidine phosphatase